MSRSKAYALLLLNAAIWGFTVPIAKRGLSFISLYEMLFLRFLLSGILFLPFYLRRENTTKTSWPKLLLLGLLGTPLCLIPLYEGLRLTSSIEASLLAATSPIFTAIGGYLLLNEKVTKQEKLGLFVAMVGTFFIIIKPDPSFVISPSNLIGDLLIIGSNIIWTGYLLILKKSNADPIEVSQISYLVSIPVFGAIALNQRGLISIMERALAPTPLFVILFLAIFASIIAYWTYNEGQRHIEASEAAVFTYLHPVFAIPLALIWLKESMPFSTVAALLVIIIGVYLSERRPGKYQKRG